MGEVNAQNETNLHNLELAKYGPWVDLLDDVVSNVPRQLLLMAAILGVVLPLAMRRRQRTVRPEESLWYWLVPTNAMAPICLMAACSTLPEKIVRAFGIVPSAGTYLRLAFIDPGGELKEYCYGMMLLFFFLSLYIRTSQRPAARMPT